MSLSCPSETSLPDPEARGAQVGRPKARPIPPPALRPPVPLGPLHLSEISRQAAGADMLGLIGAILAYQVLVRTIVGPFISGEEQGDNRLLELALIVLMGTLAGALVLVITHWRGLRFSSLGLNLLSPRLNLLLGLATAAAGFAVFQLAALVIWLVWPAGHDELLNNPQLVQRRIPRLVPAVLVAFTLFVGIWEEVVFRGFLLPRMRRLTNSWAVAVVFSSAVFAVLHVGMQVAVIVIPVFFLGVLFCAVTIWCRSLVPAIVAHFVFNLINFASMLALFPEWQ